MNRLRWVIGDEQRRFKPDGRRVGARIGFGEPTVVIVDPNADGSKRSSALDNQVKVIPDAIDVASNDQQPALCGGKLARTRGSGPRHEVELTIACCKTSLAGRVNRQHGPATFPKDPSPYSSPRAVLLAALDQVADARVSLRRAIAGLYSILFISAGTFRVQAFFIAAKNCLWPSDFYAWEKIYLFDRN
jgi:hypothetical protein